MHVNLHTYKIKVRRSIHPVDIAWIRRINDSFLPYSRYYLSNKTLFVETNRKIKRADREMNRMNGRIGKDLQWKFIPKNYPKWLIVVKLWNSQVCSISEWNWLNSAVPRSNRWQSIQSVKNVMPILRPVSFARPYWQMYVFLKQTDVDYRPTYAIEVN